MVKTENIKNKEKLDSIEVETESDLTIYQQEVLRLLTKIANK